MKTYHYCVVWHSDGDVQRHWSHGVVAFDGDLLQDGVYNALCDKIAAHMNPPHRGPELVVHSLSLIGVHE